MNRTHVIAEVSSNHHAELERCLAFVDAAAALGCSAVKFQQFRIDRLFAPEALAYAPRLADRRAWELPEGFNREIAALARERGIGFSSTPFYPRAVEVLEPLVDFFKIASYQVLWHGILKEVARTGKPVVLATGMATLEEIQAALDVLRAEGCRELTLLHCVSSYPTPLSQANLAAIDTLRERCGTPVGWSDHTANPDVCLRAVRRFGADPIELHLDLDGEGEEFRCGHCWLPEAVAELVEELGIDRPLAAHHPADGDGEKTPRSCEIEERSWRSDPSDGLRPLVEVRRGLPARLVS